MMQKAKPFVVVGVLIFSLTAAVGCTGGKEPADAPPTPAETDPKQKLEQELGRAEQARQRAEAERRRLVEERQKTEALGAEAQQQLEDAAFRRGLTAVSVVLFLLALGWGLYTRKAERSARDAVERRLFLVTKDSERAREDLEQKLVTVTKESERALEQLEQRLATEFAERERARHRDANCQDEPYTYQCSGHPNRTLALRYGIANLVRTDGRKVDGGPDGEHALVPSRSIALRKIRKFRETAGGNHYLAVLPKYGDREVQVVIKPGEEYILTFYPLSENWFQEHADLEQVLKANDTFSLKELATFHVQKTIKSK